MPRIAWIALWGYTLILFSGFWTYGLFDLDEGIYSAALFEMLQRGDWIVPTIDGAPFFEKPILIYWTSAILCNIGLSGEFALRFTSVIATIGTLWITVRFARCQFDDKTAFWALAILATCPLLIGVGRMFMPDALFVFFLSASLLAFWESVNGKTWFTPLSLALLAFAFLAKGPAAIGIYALVIGYCYIRTPDCRKTSPIGWVIGIAAFFAIVSLWLIPVWIREGRSFLFEFIIIQNIGRIEGFDEAHPGPFPYYAVALFLIYFPYAFWIFGAWLKTRTQPVQKFLWSWMLLVILIFSIAQSKLPHYILPLSIPIAILLANYGVQKKIKHPYITLSAGIALTIAAFYCAVVYPELQTVLTTIGIATAMGTCLAVYLSIRQTSYLWHSFVVIAPFTLISLVFGMPEYWHYQQGDVYRTVMEAKTKDKQVIEFRMAGLRFYGETSHPSNRWNLQKQTRLLDWFDQLPKEMNAPTIILSREGRLPEKVIAWLESFGTRLKRIQRRNEFLLYEFN